MPERDEYFMRAALEQAKLAASEGETPVGAVCVLGDRIVSVGRNRRETGKDALAHAELEAISEACAHLHNWRLDGCTMYVTLEPCPMCAGAIINARVSALYYGAKDQQTGSCGSVINLFMENYGFSPKIVGGVLADECAEVLTDFFKKLRSPGAEETNTSGVKVV